MTTTAHAVAHDLHLDSPVGHVLASIAAQVAEACAPRLDRSAAGPLLDGTVAPASAEELGGLDLVDVGPESLGDVLEQLRGREDRRRRGAFFTPHGCAATLIDRTTVGWAWPRRTRVCDPACGAGAFLLAAGRRLEQQGISRGRIVTELLWGVDTDALAVEATVTALQVWAGTTDPAVREHVVVADGLLQGREAWPAEPDGFDLVVGNPPFQNQLSRRTARAPERSRRLSGRFGAAAHGYADSAALFLLASASITRRGGRFSLLVPESFLAARDAAPVRSALLEHAALVGLWLPERSLFRASVRVCAPVFETDATAASVRRWLGIDARPVRAGRPPIAGSTSTHETWASLTADLLGVPEVHLGDGARIGRIATATAGFRDQFYGLRPYVASAPVHGCGEATPIRGEPTGRRARLVTSGAIDPVHDLWRERPVRFAGSTRVRPVVDLTNLERGNPELARWGARVLVPKIVVATQTRVVELLVDEVGDVWPSVPTVAVMAPAPDLWGLAAALSSPPVTAECLRRHAGTALSRDAIKLSAKQVLDIPLPVDRGAWDEGASQLRAAADAGYRGDESSWRRHLLEFGATMCVAYGADDAVLEWWIERLPPWRGGTFREAPVRSLDRDRSTSS